MQIVVFLKLMRAYIFLAVFFLLFLPEQANAQLLVVTKGGAVEPMVLAETDVLDLEIPQNEIDVKKVANARFNKDSLITLSRTNGKVNLTVESDKGKEEMELGEWKESLIEIEERPQTQKVSIGVYDDNFSLENKGIIALTQYALKVDAKSARIIASTESGERFVAIMPYSAVETLVKSGIVSNFPLDSKILLTEVDSELVYIIEGEKNLNFFNLYFHPVAVEGFVSALNGEVVEVRQPKWLGILGFLFD
jgi:hypothetical protein